MYENINNTTKRAQAIAEMFNSNRSFLRTWDDLYKRPSKTKEDIRDYWMREFNTINTHIVGYTGNSMMFNIYAESDTHYYLITKTHNYKIAKN